MEVTNALTLAGGVKLPPAEVGIRNFVLQTEQRRRGMATYQWDKQEAFYANAARAIPDLGRTVFVDVGAHAGLWSMWAGEIVARIVAYEPITSLHPFFWHNLSLTGVADKATIHAVALGEKPGEAVLGYDPEHTGGTRVLTPEDDGLRVARIKAPMVRLDDHVGDHLGGRRIGMLKVDAEGFETLILRGAVETIRRHRPAIVVEQKADRTYYGLADKSAVKFLRKAFNYKKVAVLHGDYMMMPVKN